MLAATTKSFCMKSRDFGLSSYHTVVVIEGSAKYFGLGFYYTSNPPSILKNVKNLSKMLVFSGLILIFHTFEGFFKEGNQLLYKHKLPICIPIVCHFPYT